MQKSFSPADATVPPLVFTSDEMPGYSRVRHGRGFSYRLPDGGLLKSGTERRRIASLAIPPAYESVWICRLPNGHLQATGIKETNIQLHHTATTCRKFYTHPAILVAFEDGRLHRIMNARAPRLRKKDGTARLHADERRVYKIIVSSAI